MCSRPSGCALDLTFASRALLGHVLIRPCGCWWSCCFWERPPSRPMLFLWTRWQIASALSSLSSSHPWPSSSQVRGLDNISLIFPASISDMHSILITLCISFPYCLVADKLPQAPYLTFFDQCQRNRTFFLLRSQTHILSLTHTLLLPLPQT